MFLRIIVPLIAYTALRSLINANKDTKTNKDRTYSTQVGGKGFYFKELPIYTLNRKKMKYLTTVMIYVRHV